MTGSKRKRRSSEKIKGTEMSANKNRWTYTNGLGSLYMYVQCLVFFALVSMPVESSPCKVTTGKCNDGTGRKSILDKSECEDAAYSLGLRITRCIQSYLHAYTHYTSNRSHY